jgi:putative MFS transporter
VVRVFAVVFLFEFADITTFSVTAPALDKDIGLSLEQVAHITSATFAGMFVGACAAGVLSRRYGRLRTIRWFLVCFSLASVGSALSYDKATILLSRVVTGAGLAALTASAITYIAETVPASRRVHAQATITGLGLLGVPLVAVFALGAVPLAPWGWRLVFVLGALGLVGLVGLSRLPESPLWLLSRGEETKASSVMSDLESGTTSVAGQRPKSDLPDPGPVASSKVSVASLFQQGYALRTMVLWSVWFLQTIAVYGFGAFVPVLLVARGVTLVGSLGYARRSHSAPRQGHS